MTKSVHVSKTKIVVSLPVLVYFLQEFLPGRMIRALVELADLGLEHFEQRENETEQEKEEALSMWLDADRATDVLWEFFQYKSAVEDFSPETPMQFAVDSAKQTLTFYLSDPPQADRKRKKKKRPDPPPPRSPETTTPLPIRLLRRGDSMN